MNRSSPVTGFFVLGKKIALSLKVVSNTKREGHSGFDVGSGYDKEDFDYSIYENISDVIGVHPKLFDTQRGVGEYIRWLTWSNEPKNRIAHYRKPIHLQSLN